jgi:hypothetical protein
MQPRVIQHQQLSAVKQFLLSVQLETVIGQFRQELHLRVYWLLAVAEVQVQVLPRFTGQLVAGVVKSRLQQVFQLPLKLQSRSQLVQVELRQLLHRVRREIMEAHLHSGQLLQEVV